MNALPSATILVTGAGGFIGSHLARHFARLGHRVLAGYRSKPPPSDGLRTLVPVRMDLAEGVPVEESVAVIVHAAAHTHLDPHATAADYVRSNVVGTLKLAEFARSHGTRLVLHLSTLSVFGEVSVPLVGPQTPLERPGLYGTSKYLAELALAEPPAGFACVSLRLPGVVGPGYFTPWLGRVLASALSHQPIAAFNPGAPFNNVVDTEELARCLEHLMMSGKLDGAHTVTLAASEPVTIAQVIDDVIRLARSRSQVNWREGGRSSFCIDTAAVARLGFHPAATRAIVERYVTSNQAVAVA